MMHICHSSHRHKRQIMKKPSCHGIQSAVMDLIDITGLKLIVSSLPADEVPEYQQTENSQRGGRRPVNEGIS